MKPQKIIVERGDTCIRELQIRCMQPDGWYEYIPSRNDRITVYIKNSDNKVVKTLSITFKEDPEERVKITFPTDLPEGRYTYDVIIETEDEKHTICNEYLYEIKEDDAYERLV